MLLRDIPASYTEYAKSTLPFQSFYKRRGLPLE